jgi:hypothetical protein
VARALPPAAWRAPDFRGKSGSQLPHAKVADDEIRIRMNPYLAELHEAGFGGIDIRTKLGIGELACHV